MKNLPVSDRLNRIGALADWAFTAPRLAFCFAGLYLSAYLIPFPLAHWYDIPRVSFASITNSAPLAALGLTLAGLALVGLNVQLWRISRRQPGRALYRWIFAGWLAAALCALFTFPGQSSDTGDYIFRAHMLAHLHVNPLTTPPSAVMTWSSFPYLGWYKTVDAYGPVWHLLAGLAHLLAGEDLFLNFLAFKLIGLISIGVSAWFIQGILQRVAPAYVAAGLALWLWNPLVLNEGVINGHNDLVLWVVLLAGIWLLVRQRALPGLLVLVTAGLIKVNAWVALPVAAIWLVRQRGWLKALRVGVPTLLCGAGLVWCAYLPLGGWTRLLDIARERSWWPTQTWTAAIFFTLRDVQQVPHETVVQVVIGAATLLFLITMGLVIWKVRDLRTGLWGVVLAYLLIGTHWFQSWYAVGLIALTALIADGALAAYSLFFTFFMLLQPIAAQYYLARFTLPPGEEDALMAVITLLLPQIAALVLVVFKRRQALSKHPA
ncbi:hypothetical protein TFLX_02410 [Thermoflexales bacterium]|nr:hypothetical protein TFLX_02410 [Thermoflexales bacterium]